MIRRAGGAPALALVLALATCLGARGAELPVVEAPPGSLVRWAAMDGDLCGMDGGRWAPLGGYCWFAVDLLRDESSISVSRWRSGTEERATIRLTAYPYPVQHITLKDDSHVDLSQEDLARAASEQKRVTALWSSREPPRFSLPLASPLRERGTGGRFGSRRFFNGQPRSPHTGSDYRASAGEPVFSVASGRAVLVEDLFFSGRSVFLDHGDGLVSMYFHLSETLVEEGSDVERGEQIGRVGQTGRATGPHLHFGLRWRGARVDPEMLLASPESVPTIR